MTTIFDMSDPGFDSDIISEIWEEASSGSKFKDVLLEFSEDKQDFVLAVKEWVHLKIGEKNDENGYCICSKKITIEHYVKNKHNGNILKIGSECIDKFLTDDTKIDSKLLKAQLNYQKNGTGSHRMCSACNRHAIGIDEPKFITMCKTCFRSGAKVTTQVPLLNGRNCSICIRPVIPNTEPEWKTECSTCYKNKQEQTALSNRQCSICLQYKISITEPKWKNKCGKCYMSTKSNSYNY